MRFDAIRRVPSASLASALVALWALAPASRGAAPPAMPQRSLRDGVYSSTQAERGERLFTRVCVECHLPDEFSDSIFLESWAGLPVQSLFEAVSTGMPENNPGGLSPEQYAEVLAYIFSLNRLPAGEEEMPNDEAALREILIEPPETSLSVDGSAAR